MIAVLQDLGGPKIRLGPIPGDAVECRLGEEFILVADRTSDDPRQLTCTYRELPRDLKAGDAVLFADGAVAMVVIRSDAEGARMKVTLAGRLRSQQGINLPGAALSVKALTDKDLHDLDWTARNAVEYVGLSFVRHADDILRLREELARRGSRARIVAKIEKPQAVENLDAIIAQADAVMVARGDLGVEMDVARVPAIQKRVIAACHRARIPVITATQMLNSMETSSRPTRAEASDVFNAVLDGTDAVMLSGETAVGQYPVEAVATMSRIVTEAESLLFAAPARVLADPRRRRWSARSPAATGWVQPITACVVEAASLVCRRLSAALAGRGHALGADGAGALEAPPRHADPRPDRRRRDRPRHGPVLGRQPAPLPRDHRRRAGARHRARLGPLARADRPGRPRRPGPGEPCPTTPATTPCSSRRSSERLAQPHHAVSHRDWPGISPGSILPELPKMIRMPPRPPVPGPAPSRGPVPSRRGGTAVGPAPHSRHRDGPADFDSFRVARMT